ncbi:MAG TPA: ATP-binding protein [Chiayiivirga sp.]|nr:ATP-binding protein [Chiayiivirga sp.]
MIWLSLVLVTGMACAALAWAWHLRGLLHRERQQAVDRVATSVGLAAEQAAAQERERIYADLHDDMGARLLTLVHTAENPRQADIARSLLQEMRRVVTRSRGTPGTLTDVLADIRSETSERLTAAGIGLDWQSPEGLPDPTLDSGRSLHLQRIVREAVSNVIRHAEAKRLRVRTSANSENLHLELTDDGSGAGVEAPESGQGLRGMRARAAELAGDIDWKAGTAGGTKVLLSIPLKKVP